MRVKIDNPTHWDGKRREAGSVIEVPAETQELNSSWMKPTDEDLKDATAPPPEKAAAPKAADKPADTSAN
jgi:cytochrome c1